MNSQQDESSTTDTVLHTVMIGGAAAILGLAVLVHGVMPLLA